MPALVVRWWEKLPPPSHPLWKLAQACVVIAGLTIFLLHGSHHLEDAAGVGAGGVGGYMIRNLIGTLALDRKD